MSQGKQLERYEFPKSCASQYANDEPWVQAIERLRVEIVIWPRLHYDPKRNSRPAALDHDKKRGASI